MSKSILFHIVTFNSSPCVLTCLESLRQQTNIDPQSKIVVTDNASTNGIANEIESYGDGKVELRRNSENIGFCGAHNQGAKIFLDGPWDYFLIVNPDVRLETDAVSRLCESLEKNPGVGSACPKLLRCDEKLNALSPAVLDAAGMYLTPGLRHFDRGSGEAAEGKYNDQCLVFGGSGACLLLSREFVKDMLLDADEYEKEVESIYPALSKGREKRVQLFDEAFFAYREDADLAWRGQLLGWQCMYVPTALGYHQRVVVPENRAELPSAINLLGVKNRFLLQINNYRLNSGMRSFFEGILLRNFIVIVGVLLKERSSLPAFRQLCGLWRRALVRRKKLAQRLSPDAEAKIAKWYHSQALESGV